MEEPKTNLRIARLEAKAAEIQQEIAEIRDDLSTRESTEEFQVALDWYEGGYDLVYPFSTEARRVAIHKNGNQIYAWIETSEMRDWEFEEISLIFGLSTTKEFLVKALGHLGNLTLENHQRSTGWMVEAYWIGGLPECGRQATTTAIPGTRLTLGSAGFGFL